MWFQSNSFSRLSYQNFKLTLASEQCAKLLFLWHVVLKLRQWNMFARGNVCCCSSRWSETMSLNCGHQRWNDTDRRKPNNSEKNLSQCNFVHHKAHMESPGREPWPPLSEVGNQPPEPWHGLRGIVTKNSVQRLAILTQAFRGFSQSLQAILA
jgi:hypothetical protein